MKRLIWPAAIVGLALCTTAAQLDRASRRQAALVSIVPAPFRSFAQEKMAIDTVRSAEPSIALETAMSLVRRRPLPAEHLSLLAIAMERAGRRQESAVLVQEAARRGWRDSIAQQAMFDISLNAGDPVEASHRLAALWALREDQVPLVDLTTRLLSAPQGRSAMAETLVAGGRWTDQFLAWGGGGRPDLFVQTLSEAFRLGARLDCDKLTRLKRNFEGRGLGKEAAAIAQGLPGCTDEE